MQLLTSVCIQSSTNNILCQALLDRLYNTEIKTVEEKKNKSESKPAIVVTQHRSYKSSINSKKNRARQTTLSSMRKNKKDANLARRRGLVAVKSLPNSQAPVRALLPSAPSTPIKKKRDSFDTYKLSQIKLEQVLQKYTPIQFCTILPALKLYSLVEVSSQLSS
jgi:hypothetical protein